MFHTGETNDATQGAVSVASSGHPDLADLPDTIASYAQALIRLRDLYAPDNVYMGLCEFDNRAPAVRRWAETFQSTSST